MWIFCLCRPIDWFGGIMFLGSSVRVVRISKYYVHISPLILTTDPHPRPLPRADPVSDPLSVRESTTATRFLAHSQQGPPAAALYVQSI